MSVLGNALASAGAVVLFLLVLVSCAPRDVAVLESTKARVSESGQVAGTSLVKPGEKLASCTGKTWSDLRLPVEKHGLVLSGKMTMTVSAGNHNCFVVGEFVSIKDPGGEGSSPGKVKISKIEILKKSAVTSAMAEASGHADLGELLDRLARKKRERLVNVVHFEIEGGGDDSGGSPVVVVDLVNEGEILADCKRPFEDLRLESFTRPERVREGLDLREVSIGRKCVQVAQEVVLTLQKQALAVVKITSIRQRSPQFILSEEQADELDWENDNPEEFGVIADPAITKTVNLLKVKYGDQLKGRPVTIIDWEFVRAIGADELEEQ